MLVKVAIRRCILLHQLKFLAVSGMEVFMEAVAVVVKAATVETAAMVNTEAKKDAMVGSVTVLKENVTVMVETVAMAAMAAEAEEEQVLSGTDPLG